MRRTALELDELAMVTGGHQAENKIPPAVREQIRAMAEICKSRGYSQKEDCLKFIQVRGTLRSSCSF